MITARIDVSKINKEWLYTSPKTGAKYLNIVLWETPDDKYGNDYRVTQEVPKEARDAGKRGEILGNAKVRGLPGGSNAPKAPAQSKDDGDVPF